MLVDLVVVKLVVVEFVLETEELVVVLDSAKLVLVVDEISIVKTWLLSFTAQPTTVKL